MDNRNFNKMQTNKDFALDKSEKLLLDVINERLGIVVSSNQIHEIRRIVANSCDTMQIKPTDYLLELQNAHIDSPIFKDLVSGITIGETYFFRDRKQMDLLKNIVLPELIHKKRTKKNLALRIWSAGCASGEELYTLIIMLTEMLPDIENWHLNLLGTDINTDVLQKALSGVYTEWSMRSISQYHKTHFFEQSGDRYYLQKNLLKKAHFTYLNLNDDNYPTMINGTNAQDLILCRNVLIYFDEKHVAAIMRKFSYSLVEDGYLLLGASDPINYAHTHLTLLGDQGKLLINSNKVIDKISPPAAIVEPIKKIISIKKVSAVTNVDQQAELKESIAQSDWEHVIAIINAMPDALRQQVETLNLKATALANMGQLEAAAACCEESIMRDALKIETYFIYAMILTELGKIDAAEQAIRKTLYLDMNFVLGHYQLGLLLIHKKDITAGIKSLRNAALIAEDNPHNKKIPDMEGLTYGKLVIILKEEINLHTISGSA